MAADTETESRDHQLRSPEETVTGRSGPFSWADETARRLTADIIDIVRTPILVLDESLHVVSANPSFYRTFHTTAAAVENRSFYELGEPRWDTPALREMLEKNLPGKKEILNFEFLQEFSLPESRNILLNAREIPGCGGGSERFLLSFEDVTDRINVENYRRAKEKAEKATHAKNEFLASMSHEIRTPMTVTIAALEHVLETDLSREQRKFLEMAMASSHSLLGIIDDILDLSRIEAGKLSFSESPFLLSNLLESVVEIFTPKAQLKGLKLSCDFSPELPSILIGDQNRLRQVLVNLLGNAIKFTHRGEIVLQAEPAGKAGTGARPFISFSVRDTGIGIPFDRQGDVFQSFSQINSPETRENTGSGLGLAICKRIVEQSGGDIGMESKEGEGSVVYFKMPFGRAPGLGESGSMPEKAAGESPEQPDRTYRILLLEDESHIRELVTMLLENRGWEVVSATSGEEGLSAWKKERFDLILMDLRMPEMDGLETTRRIRANEGDGSRHVPIIAMTAHVMKNDSEKCLQSGMDAFLAKPFKSEEFLSLVERCLGLDSRSM